MIGHFKPMKLHVVLKHFKAPYEEKWSDRPKLGGIFPETLNSVSKESLEVVFSDEEITQILRNCDSNKAPGQYGFNFKFLKKIWKLVKQEVK